MDCNNSSVPLNQIPNLMLVPPYRMSQNYQADKEKQALQVFWQQQFSEIQNAKAKSQHQLPLARIRRIMKADGDVKMISAETPILVAKACELFIQELSLRAWTHTEGSTRRTMQPCDIAKAIKQYEILDFLADVVPMENDDSDGKEADSGKVAEGTHVTEPCTAAFMNNPVMNMATEVGETNQQFPEPYMMQPPFLPSAQFPHNFHPM